MRVEIPEWMEEFGFKNISSNNDLAMHMYHPALDWTVWVFQTAPENREDPSWKRFLIAAGELGHDDAQIGECETEAELRKMIEDQIKRRKDKRMKFERSETPRVRGRVVKGTVGVDGSLG